MIEGFQEYLKTTLSEKMPATEALIDLFPDNVSAYNSVRHAVSDVLIGYAGSRYEQLGAGVTKRTILMEFRVLTRSYAGKKGAMRMLEKVIKAMWAHEPIMQGLSFSRLKIDSDGFLKSDNGIWQYFVRFKTDVIFCGEVSND